jgi:hypothetical protein
MPAPNPASTKQKENFLLFEVRLPKDNEFGAEQMASLLANLSIHSKKSFLEKILKKKKTICSLEILLKDQQISFFVVCPEASLHYIQSQILAQYPSAILTETADYLPSLNPNLPTNHLAQLALSRSYYYPLKNHQDFRDTDPLTSTLAPLSKSNSKDDFFLYQLILSPAPKAWQSGISTIIREGIVVDKEKNFRQPHPDKQVFEQKIQQPGLLTQINLLTNSTLLLQSEAASFGIYTNPRGNMLKLSQPGSFSKKALKTSILTRTVNSRLPTQVLNIQELAAIWHFPNHLTSLPNISWGQRLVAYPPENLPVATNMTDQEKKETTFIGKTEFKNELVTFGLKRLDRRRHTYIIGKTGTGKSWLLANMIIEDIRKGEGVGVIDPHGDLCDIVLSYIPKNRTNDICYFNPADPDYVYPLNMLEAQTESQKDLIASATISVFQKLYGHSWGPRLEHILRNTLLTLTHVEGAHLGDIVEILTNQPYRQKIVDQLTEPTLKKFWLNEFDRMDAKFQNEAISPILNKVGQFIASSFIRNTVCHSKSRINIQSIMDEKKIFIADLSSGKLGEDNSALLGAMLITQIQLSAMNRVFQSQEERKDFYLFVDEFQNFATTAFIKIVSEARKYRLDLTVANQYMSQLEREIQDAILGNVGSLISFVVGSQDAQILSREFGFKQFPPEELVKIGRYQILSKLSIDNQTTDPFFGTTLPLPDCKNEQKKKLIRLSQERWGKSKK